MRIFVEHQTHYDYEEPVRYAIQRIYLTPREEAGQRLIRWEVSGSGELSHQRDAFGNTVTTMVIARPSRNVFFRVSGEVEMVIREGLLGHLPPADDGASSPPVDVFLRQTPLTIPCREMIDLAADLTPRSSVAELLVLAGRVEDHLTYTHGVTHVGTTAIDAWQRGAGVCQDHAHVMLAICRAAGVPARYVSGYLSGEARASQATHAWVDCWLEGHWVSVDITHRCLATDRWIRLAIGADYEAVSPVRGVRHGGGLETMRVSVTVHH
jgi:transglutaminase-like putative cysteine protease